MVPCPVCHGRVCFQHPSFSISQSLAHHTTRNAWPGHPLPHTSQAQKEKRLHKRTIINVTYCLSRAWKLACLPACLLPGAHLVTFFYHPTTAQRSPCRPQLVQFLLWKYKQDKKKCKWVPGRHEILHYHIWFPGLCATGGFASSILWPTTLQTPCLTPPKLKKKKDFTKGP